MKLSRFSAFAGACLIAGHGLAHDYQAGAITVLHPYAFETTPTARTGGGYFTIRNDGETDDRLLAVEADFPRVMLHTTEMQDGVARMLHLEDGILVPAGETVMLKPGEMHVMFMGLSEPFVLDAMIPATLVFETAGSIAVAFKIEARDGLDHGAMDHSTMDHGEDTHAGH